MGFRYRKSFKIAKGVRVSVSPKSVGISAGVKGARISTNSRTGTRVSTSIPGTGISYSTKVGGKMPAASPVVFPNGILSCPNCRQREVQGARFCSNCGTAFIVGSQTQSKPNYKLITISIGVMLFGLLIGIVTFPIGILLFPLVGWVGIKLLKKQ